MKKFFILLSLLIFSCQPSNINIALVGNSSIFFEKYREGLLSAIEEINYEGGIKGHTIKLTIFENNFNSFEKKKFSAFFVCPISKKDRDELTKISEKEKTPLIFLFPTFVSGNQSFLFAGDIISETTFLADASFFSLLSNNALIFEFDKEVATIFKNAFNKNGGKVESLNFANGPLEEMKTKVAERISSKDSPQIFFLAGSETVQNNILETIFSYNKVVVAPFSFCSSNKMPDETLTTLVGYNLSSNMLNFKQFSALFETKYGHIPDNCSLISYESLFFLKDFLSKKSLKKETDKRKWIELNLSGKVSFDKFGSFLRPFSLAIVKDNDIKDLSTAHKEYLKKIQEKILLKRIFEQ